MKLKTKLLYLVIKLTKPFAVQGLIRNEKLREVSVLFRTENHTDVIENFL